MMKNIEVEVRSFIPKEKYEELIDFFNKNAKFVKEDYQITYYFSGDHDLRIQKNNFFSKIWLKKGRIHDKYREEIEIRCKKEDFEKLYRLFLSLGYEVEIKWFRKRHEFEWKGISVMIDYTKGYGYIIEFEKICSEEEKEETYQLLKQKMLELGIELTSKEVFEKKFEYYKKNWRTLVGDVASE
jgi:predicted adenylyl cyclase CyaB